MSALPADSLRFANLGGIVPILPTPFSADDAVDVAALERLVDFAIECGVTAVGMPAFGSEFYKLDGAERSRVLETVVFRAGGRLAVIAQCNHTAPKHAARLAVEAQKLGAAAVNTALPRAFASSPGQLVDFARAVCDSVSLPVVVQDWNPAGASVGAGFAAELHRRCRNFRFLKLEEPGIGSRIREIRTTTDGAVGVFVGWGGLYALELQAAGACGVMPGLALADIFVEIWQLAAARRAAAALDLFSAISPFIQFSLQTFEQFHHAEKRLLVARGALQEARVRPVTVELNPDAARYLDLLIAHLQSVCARIVASRSRLRSARLDSDA